MQKQSNLIRIKRKTIFCFAVILILLISAAPVLADYIGPKRTVTETSSVCKVILYECQYVAAKDTWKYKTESSWSCSNESKPWRDYPSNARTCNDNTHDAGYEYWEREDITQTETNTYPPATINSALQNCMLQNGWCVTAPQLSLSASEPVAGYYIFSIEGSLNGQTFACMNSSCSVPLNQGDNSLAYWALSSFGDSSTMGTLTAKVDSELPNIAGAFTGVSGSNGWYLSPVSFNGSASDATSGLASFTCMVDGIAIGSCNTITVNGEGLHTLVLTARDNANQTRTLTQSVSIDTQNPVLNASINGRLGLNDWYTAATLNGSASDFSPGSGLSVFEYNFDSKGWITFPSSGTLDLSDGRHSVEIRAIDKAGHIVSTSKSFWLDTSAPNITMDSAGASGVNDWYTTDLTITPSANDDTSGMDIFEYSLDNSSWEAYTAPLTLGDGIHSLSLWAQDEAGLVTQVDRIYQVDTRVPQIAGNLSGVLGMNSWYISEVTLSASASDPMPGSDLDTFTYILNNSAETPYIDPLTLSDGHNSVQLNARDKAGLSHSIEQTIQVDTIHPSLKIETTLPNWVKDKVTLDGRASDDGSGLSKVEIALDDEQTWKSVTGTDSWSYIWNTPDSPNGIHQLNIRAVDLAGLTTQQTITVGVDNHAPEISLPDSWLQWDSVTLDIWDDESGLSEVRVEISDPKERRPKRVIQLDPKQFPLGFKWDRRFEDNTVAEAGTYDVRVIALDSLGNTADKNASIRILLAIIPPGPTATLQPYTRAETHSTSIPVSTATSVSSPTATPTAIVSVFGTIEPTTQATPTLVFLPTPRSTPAQTSALDWLQSIFVPDPNEKSITEIRSLDEAKKSSQPDGMDDNHVLWGAAAAAAIGAATTYIEEEKRKREEEKARQAALEAQEEERREKMQERKMEKMEAKRAQEQAWEQAREEARREELEHAYHIQNDIKIARLEAAEETRRIASKMESKKQAEEKKKAEELNERLRAYYSAPRQGNTTVSTPENKKSFWEKSLDWIDNHQTEIALGIGVLAGVGAIVFSGGLATPLVAAAWTAGAAATAVGATAVGTVVLNMHYGRDWNENLGRNVAIAGGAATVVTGGWFLFQAATTAVGAYCAANQGTCAHVDPLLKAWDAGEEIWLNTKLTVQTWRKDEMGAAETALDLYSEYTDGGMPGNTTSKALREELAELSDDALYLVEKYGDDVIPLLAKYGDGAVDVIGAYGDEGMALLQLHGKDAIDLIKDYGEPAIRVLKAVDPKAAKQLLGTLDDDVLDYVVQQGPDAMAALSRWSAKDLREHGVELALRAKKDAKVLADVKKLIALGPIDPKHLTKEQQALINAIAANSTQYANEGQVVLGKWVDYGSGFVETAQNTGSVHYNPHPDMWNLLGDLGGANQGEAAWLINQQVIQTGINKGLPFEYTLNGVPTKVIENEHNAIEAVFAGKTDAEILESLDVKVMPIRIKELRELKNAGYKLVFDEVNNSYILTMP